VHVAWISRLVRSAFQWTCPLIYLKYVFSNLIQSILGNCVDDGGSDDETSCGSRAQYLSANCVVFTHYSGDVAAVVDEHFSRALSYADKTSSTSKGKQPPAALFETTEIDHSYKTTLKSP